MFEKLPSPTPDPLHAVMDRFRQDVRPDKIDLGVGVYRDDQGQSPVMRVVREAETRLAPLQATKSYLPLAGDPHFLTAMRKLVLGARAEDERVAAIQGAGGTGALRIAFELVRSTRPAARIHLGLPSWPNHQGLAAATGLALCTHRYFDPVAQAPDYHAILAAAHEVKPGDVFILHGPCHNPTGLDLPPDQRRTILDALRKRGAVPLVDAAYCGLADGLEADLAAVRRDIEGFDEALVTVSCSKNFGLYRERIGICFALLRDVETQRKVQGEVERLSRTLVSMPPAHGAAIVAHILHDPEMAEEWLSELNAMRQRIVDLRAKLETLVTIAPQLAGAPGGRGIFMMLPLSEKQVEYLAADHGIHLPLSGRINITGLKTGDPERLAEALGAL